MPGLDANTKMLLHFNEPDGTTGIDNIKDTTENHIITAVNTAQTDDGVTKFDNTLLLDGNSDYLTILDSPDWDIVASAVDDWTLDLQVKHTDHAGFEPYLTQREGSSDRWIFYNQDGVGMQFYARTTPDDKFITLVGAEITDTDWHHIALIKIGQNYGIYVDGIQTAYGLGISTDTYSAPLIVGWDGASSYFDGNMDEIRFQKSNYFGANPVVGLTDTITVPTAEYAIPFTGFPHSQGYIIS